MKREKEHQKWDEGPGQGRKKRMNEKRKKRKIKRFLVQHPQIQPEPNNSIYVGKVVC